MSFDQYRSFLDLFFNFTIKIGHDIINFVPTINLDSKNSDQKSDKNMIRIQKFSESDSGSIQWPKLTVKSFLWQWFNVIILRWNNFVKRLCSISLLLHMLAHTRPCFFRDLLRHGWLEPHHLGIEKISDCSGQTLSSSPQHKKLPEI